MSSTINVVRSIPVDSEAHSIQHYVIMIVSELGQVGGFFHQ